jgi:phage terminase Nu1 subunit (DNA packaging protein)
MSSLFNPDKKFTQSDIASLLGISARQVRNLTQQGILPDAKGRDGMNPQACIHAYITYKSKNNTVTSKEEQPPENDENLALIELQLKLEDKRETIAMKRAKRVLFEKSYGPLLIISDVLQQVGGNLASVHDGLISKMKLVWHDMPPEAVEVLTLELTAAANECANISIDLSDYTDGDPEDGPAWIISDDESITGLG